MSGVLFWLQLDPERLERDRAEIEAFAPNLTYAEPGIDEETGLVFHGGWGGALPLWPFDRAEPPGLQDVTEGRGLNAVIAYPASYPMIAPRVHPIDPKPEAFEISQQVWHVAPGRTLCLLQSDGDWTPESSIVDLLLKAAGWRIEYALMKAKRIERMTISGIVDDPALDHLMNEGARE